MADGGGDERPERSWAGTYILDGHTPVPEYDTLAWGRWYGQADRHVAVTRYGCLSVSTIFLGLDHNFGGSGPRLFETMIFVRDTRRKGKYVRFTPFDKYEYAVYQIPHRRTSFDYQARYATWDEAERGHRHVLPALARAAAHKTRYDKLDDPFDEYKEWQP